MRLPASLDKEFWREIGEYEENKKMPYVTSVERIGIKKGIRESVIDNLEVRFQVVPQSIAEALEEIEDVSVLKMLHKKAVTVGSIDEFMQFLKETNKDA